MANNYVQVMNRYRKTVIWVSLLVSMLISLAFHAGVYYLTYGWPVFGSVPIADQFPPVISGIYNYDSFNDTSSSNNFEFIGNIGSDSIDIAIKGDNFEPNSIVKINGETIDSLVEFIDKDNLVTSVPNSYLQIPRMLNITIVNPDPSNPESGSGIASNASPFIVKENPIPSISYINPSVKMINEKGLTLEVYGNNFVENSQILFDDRPLTYSTLNGEFSEFFNYYRKLFIVVPYSYLRTARTYNVTVYTSSPGGGTSNSKSLAISSEDILNPKPSISSITPINIGLNSKENIITVNGINFSRNSGIIFSGNYYFQANYVSPDQLTFLVPYEFTDAGERTTIQVINPDPGGGTSDSVDLLIGHPGPTIYSITPNIINAGSSDTRITIVGSNFRNVNYNLFFCRDLSSVSINYISSTQVLAVIPARYLTIPFVYNDCRIRDFGSYDFDSNYVSIQVVRP